MSKLVSCIKINTFVFSPCSTELKCKMKFAVYLPPKAETDKCPVMYWLSGEFDQSQGRTHSDTAQVLYFTKHLKKAA